MKLIILRDYDETSEWAARYIRNRIIGFNPGPDHFFTLGLPTGTSPHTSSITEHRSDPSGHTRTATFPEYHFLQLSYIILLLNLKYLYCNKVALYSVVAHQNIYYTKVLLSTILSYHTSVCTIH